MYCNFSFPHQKKHTGTKLKKILTRKRGGNPEFTFLNDMPLWIERTRLLRTTVLACHSLASCPLAECCYPDGI